MALIAMVTATESLKENVKQEFSSLGTNTFTINPKRSGGFQRGRRATPSDPITYDQSKRLAETLDGTKIIVSSSINVSRTETISRENERTNPNVQVLGIDHQYLSVCGIPLEKGPVLGCLKIINALSQYLLQGVNIQTKTAVIH